MTESVDCPHLAHPHCNARFGPIDRFDDAFAGELKRGYSSNVPGLFAGFDATRRTFDVRKPWEVAGENTVPIQADFTSLLLRPGSWRILFAVAGEEFVEIGAIGVMRFQWRFLAGQAPEAEELIVQPALFGGDGQFAFGLFDAALGKAAFSGLLPDFAAGARAGGEKVQSGAEASVRNRFKPS